MEFWWDFRVEQCGFMRLCERFYEVSWDRNQFDRGLYEVL
jgi:hypothetical protein